MSEQSEQDKNENGSMAEYLDSPIKIQYELSFKEDYRSAVYLVRRCSFKNFYKMMGILAALLVALTYSKIPEDESYRLLIAVISTIDDMAFVLVFVFIYYQIVLKWRIRRMILNNHGGTKEPISMEYEFDDQGYLVRSPLAETLYKWESIKKIKTKSDKLEFFEINGGYMNFPFYMFETETQRLAVLELARRHVAVT
jgi:hypothetical protein